MRVLSASRPIILLVISVFFFQAAQASRHRDPLNDKEIDELREAAIDPVQQLKLYVKFTQARFLALDQLRTDPMVTNRGQQMHDLLEDIDSLANEISDHIDDYGRQKLDARKAVKPVVEATSDWQLRLRTLKDAAMKDPPAAREYSFVLDTAIDDVNELADDARDTLNKPPPKADKNAGKD
jgi:hypothetical protein